MYRRLQLCVERLESRDVPSAVLLPDAELAALRQKAAANTPQWQVFKSNLDQQLNSVLSGGYEGSRLASIADYALGYEVLKTTDVATASTYADKAIALLKSALQDFQQGDWTPRQFLARGDGLTTSFVLPNSDVVSSSVTVYVGNVSNIAVVHHAVNGADPVDYYLKYIKVSNTPDGPADYVEGTDWSRNGDLPNNMIDWSPSGAEPAVGATYYVTAASTYPSTSVGFTLSGNTITLKTAPTANQAVFVQYVYGTHSADGSTLAYQQTSAGDGGFNSIFVDATYTSRNVGKYVALGYDWLSGYVGFSAALKGEAASMLVRWSDYVRDNGYQNNFPASNYGAGGYVSRVLTALALFDQNDSNASRLMNEMEAYRSTYVLPTLQNASRSENGGFWAEGWNYGELATENILLAGLAFEEAGFGTATAERQWASDVIMSLLAEQPTKATVYDGGDGYDYPKPLPSKDLFGVLASVSDNPTTRDYANYVLQDYPGAYSGSYVDLIYRDPSADATFWSDSPLERLAPGTGLVTARADWNYDSTWMAFQLGNLLDSNHQTYAPGQLQIQRGADDLLVNATAVGGMQNPSFKSSLSNLVAIDDNGDGLQNYPFNMGTWYGSPGVFLTAYEEANNYVYAAGDYRAAYSKSTNPGGGGPATKLTRQVVYLRPDFIIVHDRAGTVKDVYPKQLRWHFLNTPVVAGNSWVETVGGSKLFGQTFSSVPLTTTNELVDAGYGAMVNRVITVNSNASANVEYTTALQTAPSADGAMVSTARVASTDGQMEGVQMADQVVLFGTNGQVDASSDPVSYTVLGSGAFTHLLTDLKPGQVYTIWAGSKTKVLTATSQGTLTFTTSASASGALSVSFEEGTPTGPAFVRDLGAILEDTKSWNGTTVSALLGGAMTDGDANALQGIAAILGEGNGVWQFSANGTNWTPMSDLSDNAARLLADSYHVRFIPAANWDGVATLTFRGWDQTWGKPGATAPVAGPEIGSPFTALVAKATVSVTPVNDRPVLPASPASDLLPVAAAPAVPTGQAVANLVRSATDVDGNMLGAAVTGASGAGIWEFSTDNGATWAAVGKVSGTSAWLLAPTDLVRFVPNPGATGFGSLMFKAWDQTAGTHGTRADTTLASVTAYSSGSATAISRINTAPVLSGTGPSLSVLENPSPNLGFAVSTLLVGRVSDTVGSLQGVAVTGAIASNHGMWQYSINAGSTWLAFPAVSTSGALLLRSVDRIRFASNADYSGAAAASLTYRAWDQTFGVAGTMADVSNFDAGAFFSSASLTATLDVKAVPIAPRLVANARAALPSFLPGGTPTTAQISTLLTGLVSQPGVTVFGLAVTGVSGKGTWEYSLDAGTTWTAFGTVSTQATRLLAHGARVRFRPDPAFRGVATFSFRAWDETVGVSGGSISIPAGSSHFSTTSGVVQAEVNTAPVLDTSGNPTLPTIPADTTNPLGAILSTLLGTAFSDPDGATVPRGIAVTAVTGTGNGTWQYNAGSGWQLVGSVSATSALLLRSTDKLRFVPAPNWNGQATVSYRAWDQTFGTAGGRASTSTTGGSSAFSTSVEVATQTVTLVNHRPTTAPGYVPGMLHLPSFVPNGTPQAITVADLAGAWVIDVDGNAVGIAISGLTGAANGTWQYSRDGSTWQAVGSVSASSALLLAGTDMIRFVPNAGFNGSAQLTFRAWDQTAGTDGTRVSFSLSKLGNSLGLIDLSAAVWVNTAPEFVSG